MEDMVVAKVARGFSRGLDLVSKINARNGVSRNFDRTVGVIGDLIGIIGGIISTGAAGIFISTGGSNGILVVILVTSSGMVVIINIF